MKTNNTNTVASLNGLVSGLKKNQPKALQAVPAAKGVYQKAIRSADALLTQHHAVIVQLKQSLQNQAGGDMALLSDYGLTPRKPTGVRTPKVNVAAADKAFATRAARHTMGSKQKLKITGATVAAAATAQALASAGITTVGTPISVPAVATPPATASPAAAGIPIVSALSSAVPLVTPAASPGPAATGTPIVSALSSAVPLVTSGH